VTSQPKKLTANSALALSSLLLFVVPLLAALGNGIRLKKTFSRGNVILALLTIALPALFVMDGSVSWGEGIAAIFAYGAFLVSMLREQPEKPAHTPRRRGALVFDILKVIIGAVVIFIAGRMLVSEVIYFGGILHVPNSLIALIVLSIGTNIPELTIAANVVPTVAFGKCYEACVYATRGSPHLSDAHQNLSEILNREVGSGNRAIDDILDILNIWLERRIPGNEYEHATQKPVTLAEKPLRRCTKVGDSILDLTGGSGSTLISCEQLKRRCYMAEIEPIFCDLIIRRFEALTGTKASLLKL
jgi:hypothetical protein